MGGGGHGLRWSYQMACQHGDVVSTWVKGVKKGLGQLLLIQDQLSVQSTGESWKRKLWSSLLQTKLGCMWTESILKTKRQEAEWLLIPLKLSFTFSSRAHSFFKPLPLHSPWPFFDYSLQTRAQVTQDWVQHSPLFLLNMTKSFAFWPLPHLLMFLCKTFIHFSFTEDLTGQLNLTLTLVWTTGKPLLSLLTIKEVPYLKFVFWLFFFEKQKPSLFVHFLCKILCLRLPKWSLTTTQLQPTTFGFFFKSFFFF